VSTLQLYPTAIRSRLHARLITRAGFLSANGGMAAGYIRSRQELSEAWCQLWPTRVAESEFPRATGLSHPAFDIRGQRKLLPTK
jgi:hypothetical protein